jgi:F0F1-type ATP synthase membrane subunit b/b'
MFLSFDGTFWVQLVNFAIFFALLNVLFLKPVGAAIRKRRDYIESVSSDYDSYQAQANEMRQHAEKVRAEARREAEAVLAKSRADASNQTAELSASYAEKVQGTIEGAQHTVAGELEAAKANEAQLVSQLAGVMVDRTVGKAVT